MKIEKLNENKIRISLSIDELTQRKISLKEIEHNKSKAEDLFMDLLEESDLHEDFIVDGSQLFVEAQADNNNMFVVTITKIDNMPNFDKYPEYFKSHKTKKISNQNNNTGTLDYSVSSFLYEFNSIAAISLVCNKLKQLNCFIGKNSLYKVDDKFFILFANTTIKNKEFVKTFGVLSEFCDKYYSTSLYKNVICEKANLIIKNNALTTISNL